MMEKLLWSSGHQCSHRRNGHLHSRWHSQRPGSLPRSKLLCTWQRSVGRHSRRHSGTWYQKFHCIPFHRSRPCSPSRTQHQCIWQHTGLQHIRNHRLAAPRSLQNTDRRTSVHGIGPRRGHPHSRNRIPRPCTAWRKSGCCRYRWHSRTHNVHLRKAQRSCCPRSGKRIPSPGFASKPLHFVPHVPTSSWVPWHR